MTPEQSKNYNYLTIKTLWHKIQKLSGQNTQLMLYLCGMAQTREGNKKTFCKRNGISVEEYESRVSQGEKHCTKCKQWLPVSVFTKDISRYDGLKASCNSKGCGRVLIPKTHKGRVSTFKGKRHTAESLAIMSQKSKGRKNRLGKPHSEETKNKIRETRKLRGYRGEKCYQWKGGISFKISEERALPEYDEWRKKVFARDSFTCQVCKDSMGGNLEAHHINGFSTFTKQRMWVSNGVTLCKCCHRKFHKKYGFNNNTRKQFNSWLRTQT